MEAWITPDELYGAILALTFQALFTCIFIVFTPFCCKAAETVCRREERQQTVNPGCWVNCSFTGESKLVRSGTLVTQKTTKQMGASDLRHKVQVLQVQQRSNPKHKAAQN